MKKIIALALSAILAGCLLFTGCAKNDSLVIAIPNDTTNEARALMLLESLGYIQLKEGAGVTATVKDIVSNPYNLSFKEMEAAQLPRVLEEMDYAIINSNYAIDAGMNPVKDSLAIEGSAAVYANILSVKKGNEENPAILALVAALQSQEVVDFINEKYAGSVVSSVEKATDGYDATIDYDALKGTNLKVAATATPHGEILEIAKKILAAKEITLEVFIYTDYVQPNNVVESGEMDANYFQHVPYMDDFNSANGTHLVSVAAIHNEPMGLYGGKQTSLDAIKK